MLYRFYDAEDQLLYVGYTRDFSRRHRQHWEKSWYSRVFRYELQSFADEQSCRTAEASAIAQEKPRYNKRGNDRSATFVEFLHSKFTPVQWQWIARNRELPGSALRTLLFILPGLDKLVWREVSQAEVAKGLGVVRPAVSRDFRALVAQGVLLKGSERTYRLNPGYGWKGDRASQAQAEKDHIAGRLSVVRP